METMYSLLLTYFGCPRSTDAFIMSWQGTVHRRFAQNHDNGRFSNTFYPNLFLPFCWSFVCSLLLVFRHRQTNAALVPLSLPLTHSPRSRTHQAPTSYELTRKRTHLRTHSQTHSLTHLSRTVYSSMVSNSRLLMRAVEGVRRRVVWQESSEDHLMLRAC